MEDLNKHVLILVLVEDGLGAQTRKALNHKMYKVLILVLVEDGLGDLQSRPVDVGIVAVLILVLVEDGLGEVLPYSYKEDSQ